LAAKGGNLIIVAFKIDTVNLVISQMGEFRVANKVHDMYSFDVSVFDPLIVYDVKASFPAMKMFITDIGNGFVVADLLFDNTTNYLSMNTIDQVRVSAYLTDDLIDDQYQYVAIGVQSCTVIPTAYSCYLVLAPSYGFIQYFTWDYENGVTATAVMNKFFPYFNSTFVNRIIVKPNLFQILAKNRLGSYFAVSYVFSEGEKDGIFNLGVFESAGQLYDDNMGDNFLWQVIKLPYNISYISRSSFYNDFNMSVSNYTKLGITTNDLMFNASGVPIDGQRNKTAINTTKIHIQLTYEPPSHSSPGFWAWFWLVIAFILVFVFLFLCFVPMNASKARRHGNSQILLGDEEETVN
jgi:hypothetical protein